MVILMIIGHVCFELVSDTVTVFAEEEVVAVLAHVAVLWDLFGAAEALEAAVEAKRWFKSGFHWVVFGVALKISIRGGEEAFLA